MTASTRWFGWITLVTVLHMSEQLMFGLQELQTLKRFIAAYDGWFRSADVATVVLVTMTATLIFLAIFCILAGNRARFVALVCLDTLALGEIHHLIETAYAGHYTPGTVTAIPYVICGVLFLMALIRERRAEKVAGEVAASMAICRAA